MAIVIKNSKGIKPPPQPVAPAPTPVPTPPDPSLGMSPSKKLMMSAPQGKMHVEIQQKDGAIAQEDLPLPSPMVEGPHATVTVSMGATRNMGNYESVKFSVSVALPCAPTADDIDSTFEEARSWVDSRVTQINEALTQAVG